MDEAFNTPPEISSPPVSPFLAIATSSRFSLRWLIGIGAGAAVILGLIIFSLLCSGTFPLPKNTIFLATISPKTANHLFTREQQTTFPIEWQQTFAEDSRWPVLVGLSRSEEKIDAFVIGPRWSVPVDATLSQKTRALIRQSGGLPVDSASVESVIYRERFFSALFSRGELQGWIDPAFLQHKASSSNRIVFSLQNGHLLASDTTKASSEQKISAVDSSSSVSLHDTDIALHLSALQETGSAEAFLAQLPLEPLYPALSSLEALPTTLEIKLSSSTIQAVHFAFERALSSKDRAVLQATLEKTHKKRLITLPDGTITVERFIPSTETTSSTPAEASMTTFDWKTEATSPLNEVPSCGTGTWVARFSPGLLARLAPTHSALITWVPTYALQVWRTSEGFTVCQEK